MVAEKTNLKDAVENFALLSNDRILQDQICLAKIRKKCREHDFYEDKVLEFLNIEEETREKDKMVYRSAYQRYYRSPKWDDYSVQEYQQKMQYRNDRRSIEHRHEPWLWDSDSDGEGIEEIESGANGPTGEELPRAPRDEAVQAWVDRGAVGESAREEKAPLKLEIPEQPPKKNATYAVKRNEAKQREKERETSSRPRKHRSPEHRRKKEARKKRADSPARTYSDKLRSPPFLPYGWANDGPAELRKTHNVLASQPEVYPAALRAAKRRQYDIHHKVKAHEEAIRKKELVAPPAVDEPYPYYPKGIWTTEYQRNFCKEDDVKRHFFR